MRKLALALITLALAATSAHAQFLLVPMDAQQSNHLKAYGLTYWVLERKATAEWLLNYRNGSFLLPDRPDVRREAALRGVKYEPANASQVAQIRSQIEENNMESVILEKAPRIAVYTPANAAPWDDAVTLAMAYADIPYDKVWDPEVLQGRLKEYDWMHLHHEDFTGQYSKFYISYAGANWLQEAVQRNESVAKEFGKQNVPALKKAV
ncbi:MAG: asparagine synthetase B, partial [Longimicrobiales bacterium]